MGWLQSERPVFVSVWNRKNDVAAAGRPVKTKVAFRLAGATTQVFPSLLDANQ
jgi:hypothetical protein